MKIKGLEFFPVPSHNSYEMDLIEAKYGLDAIGIYYKLLQKIFGGTGYYAKIDEYFSILLSKESGVEISKINEIIKECVKIEMFDKEMYDKFSILTSREIQEDYLIAIRGRSIIEMEEKYLIGNAKEKYQRLKEKVLGNSANTEFTQKSEEFTQNFDRREEKKKEEKKGYEKIIEEREESSSGGQNATPKISLTRNKLNSNELDVDSCELKSSLSNEDLEKFKEVFPNKLTEGKYTVPSNFEMDKLISEVKESDFLKSNNNLSLPWLINNYDKIINGAYKDYVKKNENTIVTHNYTTEELNSFFTDLDSLDL